MKSIVVEIAPDGAVKVEAVGFRGAGCEQATRAIEQALGMVAKRAKKPDYYQAVQGNQSVGGGK